MKSLNKALSLFLCFILVLNMVPVVQGTDVSSEDLAIVSYTVPVISQEYTSDYVTIYEHEGKFFMSLNDIGDFTRSTLTEGDETLTLTHGLREVVITKSDGHMVDSGIVDQGNISLLEYNGMYLCEGIPMLQYLGAACSIHEEKELEVLMPTYTIWESIMPDYLDYYFDINQLYGGENNVKISLVCDIIADVLDGVSGHGLLGSYDIHMEDALYEVLNVDMMKYSSVKQSASEENQKINDFLTSDVYGFILDGSEKTVDGVYEVLDYYAGFYLNTEIWKNSYLEKLYFDAGDLKSASELGSQINKQVYTQSVMQADLKDVKANMSLLSVGMLAFDTAVTSYGLMQYDDDTRNLFARTINNDMIAHTNYHQAGWMSVSDKIANTLKSTESIVVNTAATKIAEAAVDEVTKYGVQKAISGLTTKSNIYVVAAQIGFYLASLINHSTNEAFSADLNAILLNEAHFDIAMMASQLLVDERDKYHFSNPESLKRIKDMFTLYYRFVIAFSENVAISIDEFGGRDDQKWVDWFSSTEEGSVANYAAAYLYRITNCVIVPILNYDSYTDQVITSNWISDISSRFRDIFTELPSEFVFASGAGAWATVINLEDEGSFVGEYHDSEMGFTGDGFPHGTVYISTFSGKFTRPEPVNEYTYIMRLASFSTEKQLGEEYYENDIRYIVSEPYGFNNAYEFYIFLPGAPINQLPEDFLAWAHLNSNLRKTLPSGYYGIYNITDGSGFVGYADDYFWSSNYSYHYEGKKSSLRPSDSTPSHLTFWPETGAATIGLVFDWSEDDQRVFEAYDNYGSGTYHISLDISEDYSRITVSINSDENVDLSAWGGTPDGKLVAEYIRE